jgi:hypothetical protein
VEACDPLVPNKDVCSIVIGFVPVDHPCSERHPRRSKLLRCAARDGSSSLGLLADINRETAFSLNFAKMGGTEGGGVIE